MSRFQHTSIRQDTQDLKHPREREYQAIYRGYLFGQFRVVCSNQPITGPMWRRSKAKAILKWFLLNPGKMCSADQLIDLFWPDAPLETAFGNLHVTIHHLRHLLEPSLTSRRESQFIHRQPNNFYWFSMNDTWWTDAADVQNLFDIARAYDGHNEGEKALFYYRKIVNYCTLGLLQEDQEEEWLHPYRQHYEYIYSQVLRRLIHIYQQKNEVEEVLEYAYLALSLDPSNEGALKAIHHVALR